MRSSVRKVLGLLVLPACAQSPLAPPPTPAALRPRPIAVRVTPWDAGVKQLPPSGLAAAWSKEAPVPVAWSDQVATSPWVSTVALTGVSLDKSPRDDWAVVWAPGRGWTSRRLANHLCPEDCTGIAAVLPLSDQRWVVMYAREQDFENYSVFAGLDADGKVHWARTVRAQPVGPLESASDGRWFAVVWGYEHELYAWGPDGDRLWAWSLPDLSLFKGMAIEGERLAVAATSGMATAAPTVQLRILRLDGTFEYQGDLGVGSAEQIAADGAGGFWVFATDRHGDIDLRCAKDAKKGRYYALRVDARGRCLESMDLGPSATGRGAQKSYWKGRTYIQLLVPGEGEGAHFMEVEMAPVGGG